MRGAWKLGLLVAVGALLAVGLFACGGGDATDSTTVSPATSTAEPATGSGAKEGSSGGSADEGSAAFLVPGGDNSIQEFGEEADSSELDEVTANLGAYLEARASGDWAKQCALLAKSTVAPLEQLAKRSSQLKGEDCAGVLEALMGSASAATRANPLSRGVAALRVEGEHGFALFHGSRGVDYFVPMVKEDGKWKVGALAPTEFS